MKYNLSEMFATKTNKQLKLLIRNRLIKREKANEFIIDNDYWPLNEVKRINNQIKKQDAILDDCIEWLNDAVFNVSEDFWDSIIEDLNWCMEGNCYKDMMEM